MEARRELRWDDADRTRLADVRLLVRSAATEVCLDPDEVDDVVQAVDELATNVLLHGYGGSGPLHVLVETSEEGVVVRLRDRAPVFDPGGWTGPERDDGPGTWRSGGFGILLARNHLDAITHRVRDDVEAGNELTLVKRRRGEGTDRPWT